jgi:hypothetical protein
MMVAASKDLPCKENKAGRDMFIHTKSTGHIQQGRQQDKDTEVLIAQA